jgi:hypothetical protein
MSKFTLCIPETKLSNVDSNTVQPCMEDLTIYIVYDFNCTAGLLLLLFFFLPFFLPLFCREWMAYMADWKFTQLALLLL